MGYEKLLGVLKHLPGQHDQSSHAGGRGKGGGQRESGRGKKFESSSWYKQTSSSSPSMGVHSVKVKFTPRAEKDAEFAEENLDRVAHEDRWAVEKFISDVKANKKYGFEDHSMAEHELRVYDRAANALSNLSKEPVKKPFNIGNRQMR